MFLSFAAGAMREHQRAAGSGRADIPFRFGCVLIALMIGLRFHVGGDWIAYEEIFADAKGESLGSLPAIADPGYYLVNIVVQWLGGELWLVNLVCGAIFTWGFTRFAEAQQRPWLAMVVAIPYLLVVVAMGYTRPAVAIGLVMAGLATLPEFRSMPPFAGY